MRFLVRCIDLTIEELNKLEKGTRPCSGRLLRKKIQKEFPELDNELCFDFPNPYEGQSRQSKTISVYVHSAIEYYFER